MRRRVPPAVILCLIAGCGFPTQGSSTPIGQDDQSQAMTSDAAGDRPAVESITVWFIRNDVLVPVTRQVSSPADAAAVLVAATAGVTPAEGSRGLRTAIPNPAMVVGAKLSGGTATVRLATEFLDIPAGDQVLALGQIVYTLTDLRGVGRVRFEIDGDPVVVPLPAGESSEDSVSRDDFSSLTSPG